MLSDTITGYCNLTAAILQPLSCKEHVTRDPLDAPAHFVSFSETLRRPNR